MTSLLENLNGLAAMPPAALRAEWRRVYRVPAPAFSPDLLARGIAYRLQEKRHGGLSPPVERQLLRLATETDSTSSLPATVSSTLRPGTRLVRSWNGQTYSVLVTDDGYMLHDQCYSSLSSIAHAITGTKWSGPRFFGIKGQAGARSGKDASHA